MKDLPSTFFLFPFFLFLFTANAVAQTSYTWNGSSSTDFATAANWTPSGVPGSGDNITIVTTANHPVLDGNRTVNNLTMTTGILKLAGYNITISNSGTLNGGTIENGKLIMTAGGANLAGTTMDCKVDIKARVWGVFNTVFKDSVWIEHTHGSASGMGGNVYEDFAYLANSNGGDFRSGVTVADTFLAPVTFNAIGAGYVYVGAYSAGNYFADDVTLSLSGGQGISVGLNASSSSYFNGDIIFNVTSGSGFINFDLGSNVHNGELLVGSSGYNSGLLTLKAYTQTGPTTVDLTDFTGSSQVSFGTGLILEGDVVSPSVTTSIGGNCHFKGKVSITKLGGWASSNTFDKKADLTMITYHTYTGGNMFTDTTTINANSLSGYSQGIGYTGIDTFLAPLTVNVIHPDMYFIIGNTSSGIYCASDFTVNNYGAWNTRIEIGNQTTSYNHFAGDIILNSDSTAGPITFKLGSNIHDGNLIFGEQGYNSGALTLQSYTNTIGTPIDLSAMNHTSTLVLGPDLTMESALNGPDKSTTLYANCRFKDDVTLPKLVGWSGYTTCDGKADLKMVQYNTYVGGNVFKDSTIITAASAQGYNQGISTTVADTFLAPVTIRMLGNQGLYVGYGSVGTYFADDVTFNNAAYSSSTIYVNYGSSATSRFDGDIYVESSLGGGINFSGETVTHNGLLKVGPNGFNVGVLTLTKYTQTENGTIDLSSIGGTASISVLSGADITADFNYSGSRPITLTGATFRGAVDMEQGSLPINSCKFFGTARLEKKAGSNNANGGNTFHGATTLENSSSGNYIYWGNSVADTFMTDLTLINHSTQPLWMNYGTTGYYGGDITMSGTSGKIIRFGSSTAGRVAVFNGSSDQHLTIATSGLDVQLYRAQLNKSGGRLKLNNDAKVDYELALTKGIIETTDGAMLSLADNVLPTASDSSYVEGKVKKIGNDAFTFPVGRNGVYRPIGIAAPSNTTDTFAAEYFQVSSNWVYNHEERDTSLHFISTNEFWRLTRDAGISQPAVRLSWDSLSSCSFVDSLNTLKVTSWDGDSWLDLGSGGTTGNVENGTILTGNSISEYQAFALSYYSEPSCEDLAPTIQGYCAGEDTSPFDPIYKSSLICGDLNEYVPELSDELKVVRVNIHVMQKAGGTGSFPNSQATIDYMTNMIDVWLNGNLSNNALPLPVDVDPTFVEDTRIRYKTTGVYFHESDEGYYNHVSGSQQANSYDGSYVHDNFAVNKQTELNVYLIHGATAVQAGIGPPFHVRYQGQWGPTTGFNINWWLLGHEIGHAAGSLIHTGSTSGCPSASSDSDGNTGVYDTYYPDVAGNFAPGTVHNTTGQACGSDIFITTNNTMGYNSQQNHYSPQQLGRFHRRLLNNMNYLDCESQRTDLDIVVENGQDITWEIARIVTGNVYVRGGGKLTIECIVGFPPETKLVVEEGGQLIVDGGLLTSSCGSVWQGVQVYGNHDVAQTLPPNEYQGYVELKNGAIIEQAKVGVDVVALFNVGETGGGIIIADDATIQNCRKAVSFGPYVAGDNKSAFSDVTFLCNKPMNDPSYLVEGTTQFVSIWGTYGIEFTDCTFEFDHDNVAFTTEVPKDRWPTGITSHYGGYRLLKSGAGNEFKNLQWGLYSFDFFSLKNRIYSKGSTFDNVYRGAYVAGHYYPRFQDGSHTIPDITTDLPFNILPYGFFGRWNAAYRLSNNDFVSSVSSPEWNYGIVVNGTFATSTASGGRVYDDNLFNGVTIGTQTEQTNSYLDISCNRYNSYSYDWVLNPFTEGYLANQGTMCPDPLQTNGKRGGNSFENGLPFNFYEVNLLDQAKYYAAGGNNPNTVPESFNSDFFVDVEDCIMQEEDPTCDPIIIGPHEWEDKRRSNQLSWSGKLAELNVVVAHLDSGQTQMLLDTIADLSTNDAILKSVLSNHSPLSDAVVVAYIDRDTVVSENNFRDVMLKNMPVSHTVWQGLQTKLEGLKDKTVEDTLRGAQNINPLAVTTTSLDREIRYFAAETHAAADEYVLHYLDNDSLDFIKPYLDTVNLYPLRLALLGLEITEGNWDEADSSLTKLPMVTVNDTAVYDLYRMFISLGRDTLSLLELSAIDSIRVREIAVDTTLDASIIAKGMLGVVLDTLFVMNPEPFFVPSERRGQEEPEEDMLESPTEASYFKAYPNPFTNQVTIEYNLTEDCAEGCFIRMMDISGRIVYEKVIISSEGPNSITLDMDKYEVGMYICSLYNNQRLLQTSRLVRIE